MVFLLALVIVEYLVLVQVFRTISRMHDGGMSHIEGILTSMGMIASAIFLTAPLLLELGAVSAFQDGKAVTFSTELLPLKLLAGGTIATLITFGYRLYRQRLVHNVGFFAVGANATGVMVGIYMSIVVVDQLGFYFPSRSDAGMANWSILKTIGSIKDLQCDSDMLVVKGTKSDTATYRCPSQGVVVMGRFSSAPLVPWPSYVEGKSHDLAVTLQQMHRDASK